MSITEGARSRSPQDKFFNTGRENPQGKGYAQWDILNNNSSTSQRVKLPVEELNTNPISLDYDRTRPTETPISTFSGGRIRRFFQRPGRVASFVAAGSLGVALLSGVAFVRGQQETTDLRDQVSTVQTTNQELRTENQELKDVQRANWEKIMKDGNNRCGTLHRCTTPTPEQPQLLTPSPRRSN